LFNHKEEILFHIQRSIEYVESLRNLSEEEWRQPIDDEKWSIAEMIAHFQPWDELMMEKRIPYFFTRGTLPKLSISENEINNEAAFFGRTRPKEEVIERFIMTRKKLLETILEIEEADWEKNVLIAGKSMTIYEYFLTLAAYDEKCFKQIDSHLMVNE